MNHTQSKRFARTSLFIALGLASGLAFAQGDDNIEEVVVTGKFLKSLQSAMEVKRNAASVVEAISPEDIGQLPDVSISDSLKRLPGLAQDRDRGNGSQISIRGMGGMLGFTTLNGREVAILEETRNIRYDQFPSELVNGAQVYKTPQAFIPEGGVSGTVNLDTIKPLDYDTTKVVADIRATAFDLGKDVPDAAHNGLGTRLSLSYIDQYLDNTLGVAAGFSTRSEPIATSQTELWNYGDTWHNGVWQDSVGGQVNAPWGGSAMVRGGEDKRDGALLAVQWRPSDELEIAYDGFYSTFDINEEQRGFDFGIDNSWDNHDQWVLTDTAPTAFDNVGDNSVDLLAGTVPLNSLRNLNEQYVQKDKLTSNGLKVKWTREDWTIAGDVGISETSRDKRWASVRTTNTAPGTATFSTDSKGRLKVTLNSANLTDLAQNPISEIEVKPEATGGDKLSSYKLDFTRALNAGPLTDVKFGLAMSSRSKFEHGQQWKQSVTADDALLTSDYLVNAGSSAYDSDGLPTYLTIDRQAVINDYFGGLANPAPNDVNDLMVSWDVDEDISAQYVQLDFESEIMGKTLSGNIGVRNVVTENSSHGYQAGAPVWVEVTPDNWQPIVTIDELNIDHKYSDVLPSMNLTFGLTDDQLIRFAAAKTMARAPVNMMSPSLNLEQDLYGANPGESVSGNPKLNPFRATQTDLSYEWYYSDKSQFSVALFYKDLTSFIARAADAETVIYNDTEYQVSRPVNGSGGYIRGFEVLWQQSFDFLPAPFDGLGIYTNYSHNESNVEQTLPLHSVYKAPLTGLSENVGNFTVWYYLSGFEARVNYSYRSDFQRDINLVQGASGYNDAEGYWDASLSYEIDDHYKVSFQVQNLTNSPYKTYGVSSNNPNHIGRYEEFGMRYSVGFNWKL